MKGTILLAILGVALGAPSERRGDSCEVCVLLVDEVQGLISAQETQASVLDYVTRACSNLDSEAKDVCRTLTDQYSGDLFKTLATHLSSRQFCQQLPSVCDVENVEPVSEEPPVFEEEEEKIDGNPIECELCKLAIVAVDRLIKGNKSVDAINSTLEKFCDSLPAALSSPCKEIEPTVLDALKNGVDPELACKVATLCDGETSFHIPCETCLTAMDAIGLQDPNSVCAEMNICVQETVLTLPEPISNSVITQEETPEEQEVEDTLECQLCKLLLVAIDKLVGENKTAATINATLLNFCDGLPGEIKDACINIEPEILKAILGGIDPTMACDFVKACQNTASVPFRRSIISCDLCKEALANVAGEDAVDICNHITEICEDENRKPEEKKSVLESTVEIGDDARCELCKYVVTLVDQVVQDKNNTAQINATLFEICKALPAQLQQLCVPLIPQIEKIIQTGLNPTNSCIAISFCTEEYAAEATGFPILTCDDCNTVAEKVLPEKDIEKFAEPMCYISCRSHQRSRRSIADQMEYWVSQAMELQQFVPDDGKVDASFLGCEVCKIVVRLVDEIAGQNASIQTVNSTMLDICNRLTGKQLVDICLQEAPKLISFMADGIEPLPVCQAASMCDKGAADEEEDTSTPDLYSILYDKGMKADDKVDEPNDLKCDICEELIKIVDGYVEQNDTDKKINQTLYSVCSGLPTGTFQDVCMSMIPEIMKTIEDGGLDPEKACTAAGLCTGLVQVSLEKSEEKEKEEPKSNDEPNDLACDLCKDLIKFVDSRIQDNATDEKINQTLYQICSGIPEGAIKALCASEIPAIMKAVESGGWDPEKVCDGTGLCPSDMVMKKSSGEIIKPKETEEEEMDNLKDLKCDLCEAVIDEIDTVLAENRTIAEINATAYGLCNRLQGALQDVCLSIEPQVVNILAGGVDYKLACGIIGLCPKTQLDKMRALEEVEEVSQPLVCDACAQSLQLVYNELDSDYPKIQPTLAALCNNLPAQYQSMCAVFVGSDNGLYFKQFLEQVNPEVLCDAIHCQ